MAVVTNMRYAHHQVECKCKKIRFKYRVDALGYTHGGVSLEKNLNSKSDLERDRERKYNLTLE